jgi:UDP-N-acetylmuramoyl-L-alanyl-D-glutamate--2,6-diaminopimelate ligase
VRAWDEALTPAAAAALAELGVSAFSGGDGLAGLDGVRTVVKSPGVPPNVPLLHEAAARGIETIDELELGWRLTGVPVVGVTGTSGKSTTAALITAVLAADGRAPVLAGNTTAGPPLSAANPSGWVVAEVSSYQLAGAPCFLPDAAVLTNITRDHVHWHGSLEEYARAKRRMFVRGDHAASIAVLNSADPVAARIEAEVAERGGRAITYDVTSSVTHSPTSATVTIGGTTLRTRLPGHHNALNVAAALALCDALDVPRAVSVPALERTDGVPGRFERVDAGQPFEVIVDFAHTPDAVEKALATARELARGGRVIAVLGTVGRGDPLTRRLAARAARSSADLLVLCTSSLRGEHGVVSLADLLAGARAASGGELLCVLDRERAIRHAVGEAGPGDVVMIMGRGPLTHLATDRRGGSRSFDDRDVTRRILLSA